MAARRKKILHDESTRAKIQAAQIINRLQNHIDGKVDLTSSQVSAAKILLDKILPNLQATELSGAVETKSVMRMPTPAETAEAWKPQAKPH